MVDARGVRASEGFNVSQSSTISVKRSVAKRLLELRDADLSTAADGACDVPADAVDKSSAAPGRWCSGSLGLLLVAQRFAFELDLVAAVHDAVKDRVSECGVVQVSVPGLHRQLARDQS